MSKRTKVLLLVAAAAVTAYLVYKWYKNRQASQSSANTSGLGSNLNSVAPSLSAAPSVGPAVSIPVTISISDQEPGSANPVSSLQSGGWSVSPVQGRHSNAGQIADMYNMQRLESSGQAASTTTASNGNSTTVSGNGNTAQEYLQQSGQAGS